MTQEVTLSGVLVALVTPFTTDGSEIDFDNLRAQVDRQIAAGVHGLVPGGSTGEFTTLSVAERKQLTEECVKAVDGRVPVVAGIGALTTAEAVDLSKHAASVGADAVMVVPPFYEAPNLEELKAHLAAIHRESGLPIVYYNIPAATGVHLTAKEIAALGEVEGVQYLKDTSGDAVALSELLVAHRDKITPFNGWDTLTFFGLASGATGTVWGATNVIPELSMQLWDAVAVRGDLQEGRAIWDKIWPICDLLDQGNYAAAVKAGLELVGHSAGPVREPVQPLDEQSRGRLAELLTAAGAR